MKASGSSSPAVDVFTGPAAPRLPAISTTRSAPNSSSTCRQAPHGGVGSLPSAQMAMASNARSPSAMARQTAARSAQIDSPKLAFSTLVPR